MRVNSHAEVTEEVFFMDMTGNVGSMGDTSKISTATPIHLHRLQLTMPDSSIMWSVAVIG